MMQPKRKAFAYITRGNQLLVFEHVDIPEAGIQVPAGSIEADEAPEAAALREAQEESGLQNLLVVGFLGEQILDVSAYGKQELHHRYFYHLTCDTKTPASWQHGERYPSDDPEHERDFKYIFRFYWVEMNELPQLIAEHDFYVDKLKQ